MIKRTFDILFSLTALLLFAPALVIVYLIAMADTRANGIFLQKRVGRNGKLFTICKLRTIHPQTKGISKTGRLLRKYKIDELPQLINVLKGDMSLVGPRPDVEGYYNNLQGENRKILELRPGITSRAAIKYRNEEEQLAMRNDAQRYNDEVIFPDKVKMNLDYFYNKSFIGDLRILAETITCYTQSAVTMPTAHKETDKPKRFRPVILFIVKFFAVYFILLMAYNQYLAIYHAHNRPDPYSRQVAHWAAKLGNIARLNATTADDKAQPWTWIYVNEKKASYINEGCNAISIMITFVAFIIAFSTTWKKTSLYILAGLAVIQAMNVFRITLLNYIFRYHHEYGKAAHDYLFPTIIYGTIFILWVVWVNKFVLKQQRAVNE